MRKGIIIIFTLFAPLLAGGQAPKYSNEFLDIGVGARSLAMANTGLVSAYDATATYWNPAGLVMMDRHNGLAAMHAEYFAGLAKFDYLGGARKLDEQSALGFSILRFGVDNIPNTLDLVDGNGNVDYDRISRFSVADYAFLTTYSRKTGIPGLRLGGNIKLIHRSVGDFAKAWGFGLDAGTQYDHGPWKFAAMARDITSTFNAWSFNTEELEETFAATGNEIPRNSLELTLPRLIIGAARDLDLGEDFGLLAELNLDLTFDGKRPVLVSADPVSINPHLGLEASYKQMVFLRAGIGNIQKIPDFDNEERIGFQPNLGLGLKIRDIQVDYALTDIGDQSIALYSNIFSLSWSFDLMKDHAE